MNFKLLKYQITSGSGQYFSVYLIYWILNRTFRNYGLAIFIRQEDLILFLLPVLVGLNIFFYYRELIGEDRELLRMIPVSRQAVFANYLLGNLIMIMLMILGLTGLNLVFNLFMEGQGPASLLFSRDYLMSIRRQELVGDLIYLGILTLNLVFIANFLVNIMECLDRYYLARKDPRLRGLIISAPVFIILLALGLVLVFKLVNILAGSELVYSLRSGRIVGLDSFRPEKKAQIMANYITRFKYELYIRLGGLGLNGLILAGLLGLNLAFHRKWTRD